MAITDYLIYSQWILPYRTDALTSLFKIFPFFASSAFYILVIVLGYWNDNKSFFRSLGVAVCLSTLLNTWLKALFQIPRPAGIALIPIMDASYGFPSGDVQVAIVFWRLLCSYINRRWLWSIASALLIGIAVSRVYLGVHSLLDVMGATVIGLATIPLYNRVWKLSEPFNAQKYFLLFVAACLEGIYGGFNYHTISHPNVVAAGTLIGIVIGSLLDQRLLTTEAPSPAWLRLLFNSWGILSLCIISWVFSALIKSAPPSIYLLALKYASLGFMGMFGSQFVYKHMKPAFRFLAHRCVKKSKTNP